MAASVDVTYVEFESPPSFFSQDFTSREFLGAASGLFLYPQFSQEPSTGDSKTAPSRLRVEQDASFLIGQPERLE